VSTPNTLDATTKPWGAYKPQGMKALLRLIVKAGFSHGPVKKWLQKLWFSDGALEPVDIEYSGVKFRLHPWDNVVERKLVFGSKCRDCEEVHFLMEALNRDSIFLDVGANIGYYTCMLASRGVARCIAIEPHPRTRERLNFNIKTNNFEHGVEVVPIAIGDSEGTVVLNTFSGDLGSSSLLRNKQQQPTCHTVPMKPLLHLCGELGVQSIDAMKIDIEGFEDRALVPFFQDAPPTLWPRYIIIEHSHTSGWSEDVVPFLEERGYVAQKETRGNTIYALTGTAQG